MSRLARVVVPGLPHLVTQRGNRRQPIFFEQSDYAVYRDLLAERCRKAAVEVWAYCFMPDHVHLIMVPQSQDGLARAIGETHRQYTTFVNARARWTGHLFRGRFSSVALDDDHLTLAASYTVLNPVRARLAARAQDWEWTSVQAHLAAKDDALVRVGPLLARPGGIAAVLDREPGRDALMRLRMAESSGRPLGSDAFVSRIEKVLDRPLLRQKPGRKPKRTLETAPISTTIRARFHSFPAPVIFESR